MSLPIFQRTVVDDGGNVQPASSVTVFVESTGLPATIYSDRDGLFPITQPLITGIDGLILFYADSDEYRIQAVSGAGTATWRYVIMGNSTIEAMQAADEAEASAAAALVSETNAGNSQAAAGISETNAGNSQTAAGISETNAGNSASAASSSETAAGISETNAGNSETNAAADAAAADATLKDFETKYLGAFAVAPTLDNEGNALVVGAAYWLTTEDKIYIWNGAAWAIAIAGGTAATYDAGPATGEILVNKATAAGHVKAGSSQIITGANSTGGSTLAIVSTTAENSFETFGPTGSGATNIWDAMDGLPSQARILKVSVYMDATQVATSNVISSFYATAGSETSATNTNNNRLSFLKMDGSAASEGSAAQFNIEIPLNSSQVFRGTWSAGGEDALVINLLYRGFTTN